MGARGAPLHERKSGRRGCQRTGLGGRKGGREGLTEVERERLEDCDNDLLIRSLKLPNFADSHSSVDWSAEILDEAAERVQAAAHHCPAASQSARRRRETQSCTSQIEQRSVG